MLIFCGPFYHFLDLLGKNVAHSFKGDTPLIDTMYYTPHMRFTQHGHWHALFIGLYFCASFGLSDKRPLSKSFPASKRRNIWRHLASLLYQSLFTVRCGKFRGLPQWGYELRSKYLYAIANIVFREDISTTPRNFSVSFWMNCMKSLWGFWKNLEMRQRPLQLRASRATMGGRRLVQGGKPLQQEQPLFWSRQ